MPRFFYFSGKKTKKVHFLISLWAFLFSFFGPFTFLLPFFLLPLSLSLSLSPCLPVSFPLIELDLFNLPSFTNYP